MQKCRNYLPGFLFLLIGLLLLSGCGNLLPGTEEEAAETLTTTTVNSPEPPPTVEIANSEPTTAVSPNNTQPTAEPASPTSTIMQPTATTQQIVPDLSISAADIFMYPVPEIYAGDKVTFQILANVPASVAADAVPVQIVVDGNELVRGTLGWRNLAGDAVGLFEWVWDTSDQIGEHAIQVVLDRDDLIQVGDENPNNNLAMLTAVVQDPSLLLPAEANATWVTAETTCCFVHAVSNTAAYRDLTDLLGVVENSFARASAGLVETPNRKYDVYFIDRVIGQGGYAGSSMVISYLDRQYSSSGLAEVVTHEAVHLIDRQFAPQRITFLAEGLAVWVSGGHYKQEDLRQRSAALVQIGRYLPLAQLIDDFYPVQHEIGYLEASGFISYLIDVYGWSQFKDFYADVTYDDAATLSESMNINLRKYYGITLAEAEANWLAYLAQIPLNNTAVIDLQTTLRFYDIMRYYQQRYDPTAYFLTAWLPYPQTLEEQGNPADLTRHPASEINVALELMLHEADMVLRNADYDRANALLDSVERVLNNDGIFIDPLSVQYMSIVQSAASQGYEVQQVSIDGNQATIWATRGNTAVLTSLSMTLNGREWVLSE